jgi:hypothetical protein
MSFPAYEAIGKDIGLGFARWRVYMHLVHAPILNHRRPVEVKVSFLATALKMSPRKVIDALEWLTAEGYLIEEAHRGERRVRALTLAWEITKHAA